MSTFRYSEQAYRLDEQLAEIGAEFVVQDKLAAEDRAEKTHPSTGAIARIAAKTTRTPLDEVKAVLARKGDPDSKAALGEVLSDDSGKKTAALEAFEAAYKRV